MVAFGIISRLPQNRRICVNIDMSMAVMRLAWYVMVQIIRLSRDNGIILILKKIRTFYVFYLLLFLPFSLLVQRKVPKETTPRDLQKNQEFYNGSFHK